MVESEGFPDPENCKPSRRQLELHGSESPKAQLVQPHEAECSEYEDYLATILNRMAPRLAVKFDRMLEAAAHWSANADTRKRRPRSNPQRGTTRASALTTQRLLCAGRAQQPLPCWLHGAERRADGRREACRLQEQVCSLSSETLALEAEAHSLEESVREQEAAEALSERTELEAAVRSEEAKALHASLEEAEAARTGTACRLRERKLERRRTEEEAALLAADLECLQEQMAEASVQARRDEADLKRLGAEEASSHQAHGLLESEALRADAEREERLSLLLELQSMEATLEHEERVEEEADVARAQTTRLLEELRRVENQRKCIATELELEAGRVFVPHLPPYPQRLEAATYVLTESRMRLTMLQAEMKTVNAEHGVYLDGWVAECKSREQVQQAYEETLRQAVYLQTSEEHLTHELAEAEVRCQREREVEVDAASRTEAEAMVEFRLESELGRLCTYTESHVSDLNHSRERILHLHQSCTRFVSKVRDLAMQLDLMEEAMSCDKAEVQSGRLYTLRSTLRQLSIETKRVLKKGTVMLKTVEQEKLNWSCPQALLMATNEAAGRGPELPECVGQEVDMNAIDGIRMILDLPTR